MNPLSAIFAAGVSARNALYDRRILATRKLSRPVVSIGNLSVGGSGKTPFVIALGELFKDSGIAFDVLSRGYGRSGQKLALVDPQGTSEQFGDEPLLIARKLHVPVIVAADRYQAGLLAEEKFPSKLHLLDDAFQHRRLHRDFDIVMLPAADLDDTLLPIGRLREPLSSLRRADAVVLTSASQVASRWNPEAAIWHARRETFLDPAPAKAVAFCGIARPHVFFDELRILRADLCETIAFPDHHRYSQSDIQRLLARKAATGAQAFITTEKDEINLGPLAAQLQPLHVARLQLALEDPQKAMKGLLHTLVQRSGCGL